MPFRCSLNCCRAVHNSAASITFHRLPAEAKRRQRRDWISIVRLVNGETWEPTVGARICGRHFVNGKPSKRPFDPNFVPTENLFKTEILRVKGEDGQEGEIIVTRTPISIDTKPAASSSPAVQADQGRAEELILPCITDESTTTTASHVRVKQEPVDTEGLPGSHDNTEELITGDLPDRSFDISTSCVHVKEEPPDNDFPVLAELHVSAEEFAVGNLPDAAPSGKRRITKAEPYDDCHPLTDLGSVFPFSPAPNPSCQLTNYRPTDPMVKQEHPIPQGRNTSPDAALRSNDDMGRSTSLICSVCSTTIVCSSSFKARLNVDVGTKLLMCGACFKSSAQKSYLNGHVTHEGDRYPCDLCTAAFADAANLESHARAHLRERPHKCKRCPSEFVRKCDLIRHMRTHTIGNLLRCEYCPALYNTSYELTRHLSKHMGAQSCRGVNP